MRTRQEILEEFDNLPHTNLTTREWLSQILEEVVDGVPKLDDRGDLNDKAAYWRNKFLTPSSPSPASPEQNK